MTEKGEEKKGRKGKAKEVGVGSKGVRNWPLGVWEKKLWTKNRVLGLGWVSSRPKKIPKWVHWWLLGRSSSCRDQLLTCNGIDETLTSSFKQSTTTREEGTTNWKDPIPKWVTKGQNEQIMFQSCFFTRDLAMAQLLSIEDKQDLKKRLVLKTNLLQ
jgi:hypothetical protein